MPERHVTSLRPLVRYVDEQQAVIDVHVPTHPGAGPYPAVEANAHLELFMEIAGADGFHDESRVVLPMRDGEGGTRFEIVEPQRWWPAGMGEQPLYEMTLTLMHGKRWLDQRHVSIGLTSVRPNGDDAELAEPRLLVNGQVCAFRSVLPVDRIDENQLLPVTGDSLLLVRDHYGPDVLYQAADRAGVLLVQCVPIHPLAQPEQDMIAKWSASRRILRWRAGLSDTSAA